MRIVQCNKARILSRELSEPSRLTVILNLYEPLVAYITKAEDFVASAAESAQRNSSCDALAAAVCAVRRSRTTQRRARVLALTSLFPEFIQSVTAVAALFSNFRFPERALQLYSGTKSRPVRLRPADFRPWSGRGWAMCTQTGAFDRWRCPCPKQSVAAGQSRRFL